VQCLSSVATILLPSASLLKQAFAKVFELTPLVRFESALITQLEYPSLGVDRILSRMVKPSGQA
jgi:hypothetical protein